MRLIEKLAQGDAEKIEKRRRGAGSVIGGAVTGGLLGHLVGMGGRKGTILGAALGGVTGAVDEFYRRKAETLRDETQKRWATQGPSESPSQAPHPF